jgi:hypothetical protein
MVCAIAALALEEAVRHGASTSTFRGCRVRAVCIGVVPAGDGTWRNVRLTVGVGAAEVEACIPVEACDVPREPTSCARGPLV